MKLLNIFFTSIAVALCQLAFSQTLFVDNFSDGIMAKWHGNDHFDITETNNCLKISINKNPWESFTLDLEGTKYNNSLVVSFDIKTSKLVALRLDVLSKTKRNFHETHYEGKKVPSVVKVIEVDHKVVRVVYDFSDKMRRLKDKRLGHISFYPDPGSPFEGELEISNFKISTKKNKLRSSKIER